MTKGIPEHVICFLIEGAMMNYEQQKGQSSHSIASFKNILALSSSHGSFQES